MKKFKIYILALVATLAVTVLSVPPLRAQLEGLTFNIGTYWIDTDIVPSFSWGAVNNYLGGYQNAIPGGKLERYGSQNWYLQWILEYTSLTFQEIYKSQALLTPMTTLSNSLLAGDNSQTTANLQSDFGTYANQINQNMTSQIVNTNQTFIKDFFSQNGLVDAATPQNLPYANQLTYTTLLGQPYFPYDKNNTATSQQSDSLSYIENASGAMITHKIPASDFGGSPTDQDKYMRYFKTISAIQTYNSYVLSDLYYDSQNKHSLTSLQQQLIADASDSAKWFSQVATEKMGIVFRQTLLFTSQLYLLMVQMVQLQKQLLATQAMTNSLLIIGNQFTENILLKNAENPSTSGGPSS